MNSEKQNDVLRKQLQLRLNDTIKLKNQERTQISAQQKKKIEKQVDKEKKLNDNDPRVTQLMKDYYVNALKLYPTQEIYDPHTILEHMEEEKLKYYKLCITIMKNNNNNAELLDNAYCRYMKCVLGLE